MSNNNSFGFICSSFAFETLKLEFNSTKEDIGLEVRKLCGGIKLQAVHKSGSGEVLYETDLLKYFLFKYSIRHTKIE